MKQISYLSTTAALAVTFLLIGLEFKQIEASYTKPKLSEWISGRQPDDKLNFISWLVDGCLYYNTTTASRIPRCKFNITGNASRGIDEHPSEFQTFDGFSNNIFHNQLGAVDTPLLRRVPPVYDDGTYQPVTRNRINPFTASEALMTRRPDCGKDKAEACGSKTGKSAFLVYFGQQVVEEILDAQRPGCPPEYFNIEIPEGHRLRNDSLGKTSMPFLRSRYSQATGHSPGNPRQQLNEITPWIDGGLIYGTAKGWADVLRTFPNGTLHPNGQLASDQDQGLFPVRNEVRLPMANPPPPARHEQWINQHETSPVKRFYVLGNPRGNENAFLLSFGVVLFRWHNQFAKYFHETRPLWSGERVFQEARKWAIGTYQQIVIYDWLPEWLGEPLDPYKGYDPTTDPQIEQFFQTAAMRFGHTLVTPGAYLRDYACAGCKPIPFHGLNLNPHANLTEFNSTNSVRTCNIFWRPQEPLEMKHESHKCLNFNGTASDGIADIDRLLMGMASQLSEREDNMIVEDLRGKVFGPLEFSRRDLMAINIQRGRDHGTPDYNTAREAFGLKRITSTKDYMGFTKTSTSPDILNKMVEVHTLNNQSEAEAWNNIDVWTGGILETNNRPGELFRAIIKDQFTRIRNADRFWFENTKWKKPRLTGDQITRIKTLKVVDMLLSVTRMLEEDIQPNPFRVPTHREITSAAFRSKCQLNTASKIWARSSCSVYKGDQAIISDTCYHLPQLDSTLHPVEPCTELGTYDYFSGSEVSFILTFVILGLVIIGIGAILRFVAGGVHRTKLETERKRKSSSTGSSSQKPGTSPLVPAREWLGWKEGTRSIGILMNYSKLEVRSTSGALIRFIDFSTLERVVLIEVDDEKHMVIVNKAEYDLVLQFESKCFRDSFRETLETHLERHTKTEIEWTSAGFKQAVANITTVAERVAQLEKFFRSVFQFQNPDDPNFRQLPMKERDIEEARKLELSKTEFADALGMSPTCSFVESMFNLVDLDKNGFISFEEFFAMLVIFKSGNAKDKCHYLFRMYDKDRNGRISYQELQHMVRSMVETGSEATSDEETRNLVEQIISSMNCTPNSHLSLEEFENIFTAHAGTLGLAELDFAGINRRCVQGRRPRADSQPNVQGTKRKSYLERTVSTVYNMHDNIEGTPPPSPVPRSRANQLDGLDMVKEGDTTKLYKHWIITWFETKRLEIFWTTLYTSIVVAIFAERAYYYSVEREHGGLRHIAGYGVTITRGFASVQMFCYATLLLTMCRNTITHLRDTFLHRFIPFDAFVSMHKYVAYLGLFGTVGHVLGHAFNFYHISTQPADDLTCLFRDFYRQSHVIPKFHYWTFQTVTGLSGILLVILAAVIYTFATKYSRKHTFKLFWLTHALYPLWYALILLHGSGQMVQSPLFFNFLIGPLVLFVADKLVTTGRQMFEIPVLEAELLPSQVTKIKFARPTGFEFKSGQWIRIACTALNPHEFHPFTISSSPLDRFLTVHIRAVGPFTTNIRQIYESALPKLHLDGPYGEAHQDWHRYEVSVLVGGGIGVTPFASILKDIAEFTGPRQCKKVYFLWVTRTQKQFEWLVEIIKSVENHRKISVHVFITQSRNKFDLRTVLLYACERNFHKNNDRSLFTGLKSTTHFGKPDFLAFMKGLKEIHPNVSKFGVFSCGPPPMCKDVDEACKQINNEIEPKEPIEFQHRSEMF